MKCDVPELPNSASYFLPTIENKRKLKKLFVKFNIVVYL